MHKYRLTNAQTRTHTHIRVHTYKIHWYTFLSVLGHNYYKQLVWWETNPEVLSVTLLSRWCHAIVMLLSCYCHAIVMLLSCCVAVVVLLLLSCCFPVVTIDTNHFVVDTKTQREAICPTSCCEGEAHCAWPKLDPPIAAVLTCIGDDVG